LTPVGIPAFSNEALTRGAAGSGPTHTEETQMKTYTKKIGADRAIASITAANTELFELAGRACLEEIERRKLA